MKKIKHCYQNITSAINRLIPILIIFGLGYVVGSIHAPFEIAWRSGDGLPSEIGYSLPAREAMDELFNDNLER